MGHLDPGSGARVDRQFLAGGSFANWLRLLRAYGPPDGRYLPRALYVSTMAFLGIPFRVCERARFGARIEATRLDKAPVFIIGHWRTGTTYVHQLLAKDPQFATVSVVQTMLPGIFMGSRLPGLILGKSLPEKRPMDNVRLAPDAPEEEEYALANMCLCSFYHALCYPRRMRDIFDRCVLFEGVDAGLVKRWKHAYVWFLKKVALAAGVGRLVLKNPANTARIRVLLELFPGAKFVHVYRNPFVVYASTMHWLAKETELAALQDAPLHDMEENALLNYEKLMARYFEDKQIVPEGSLVEVRFEDIEHDPLGQTSAIYEGLGLALESTTVQRMQRLVASLAGYQKNVYHPRADAIARVAKRWAFAIERWSYAPPW